MGFSGGCNLTTEVDGQRAVISVKGEVTIGRGEIMLREAISDLLGKGIRNIVIDLEDVTKIDSSGIAELVSAHRKVSEHRGTLKLLGLSAHGPDFPDFPDFPSFPDGFAY